MMRVISEQKKSLYLKAYVGSVYKDGVWRKMPEGQDPLQWFLTTSRTGNQMLYASAAVEAFRAHGIPARYVEGYYLGASKIQDSKNGEVSITGENAHAWVEVYFDGVGWKAVDVTPGYYYNVATHFGRNGEADRYSSKLFAVAGIYLFLLAVHILCSVITEFDPKKRNVGSKIYHLILCICPVVSLWCGVMIYGNALGYKDVINLNLWTNVLLGIVLIVVGNYLPKCRQNYMIGIKLPWTLDNEENWDYTHRMAGKWWIIGGVLTILLGFQKFVDPIGAAVGIILIVTLIPAIASYIYYKKHRVM